MLNKIILLVVLSYGLMPSLLFGKGIGKSALKTIHNSASQSVSGSKDVSQLQNISQPNVVLDKNGEPIINDSNAAYNMAEEALISGRFDDATALFEAIFLQYPSSQLAPNAVLRASFSRYMDNDAPGAIAYAEDFIAFYKFHKSLPYAYYLRALGYYGIVERAGSNDSGLIAQALDAFESVVTLFPNSEYSLLSKEKIYKLKGMIAENEMNVGMFYLKFGDFVSALARFSVIISNYYDTAFAPEALYRVSEIYSALGINDLSSKYAGMIEKDFKDTEWYNFIFLKYAKK